jgi:hypothetical protein
MTKGHSEQTAQSTGYAMDCNQGSRGIIWAILLSIPIWLFLGIIMSKLLFK